DVGAEADIVIPIYLRRVLRKSVAAFIAEDRAPVILVAQTRVVICDLWEPALSNVRTVSSANAQNIQTDVLPEVGAGCLVMAVRDREVTVNKEATAERPGVTHSSNI